MEINVKLVARLKIHLPEAVDGVESVQFFQDRVVMSDLLEVIDIPLEEIMAILVNSVSITEIGYITEDTLGEELHDGDTVELFPPMMIGG